MYKHSRGFRNGDPSPSSSSLFLFFHWTSWFSSPSSLIGWLLQTSVQGNDGEGKWRNCPRKWDIRPPIRNYLLFSFGLALLWEVSWPFNSHPSQAWGGRNVPHEGDWDQAAFSLWWNLVYFHKVSCLGRALCLVKAASGNPRTGSWPSHAKDLTWNFYLDIHGQ